MRVLVIGSGGREHAICHALLRSPRLKRLFVAPGNAGTERLATNVALDANDISGLAEFARREDISLTIVGPEEPLANGIVDAFEAAGLRVFGPLAAAARLEADKAYAKQVLRTHAVPTAEARVFSDYAAARQYIATRDEGLVVKAVGLAKGKGVIVCDDPADAIVAAERVLVKKAFGEAGARIIVEEKLEGREVSVMMLVDGRTIYLLEPARDYKRLRDGDAGPNTGGMGSVCPGGEMDDATLRAVEAQIIVPTLHALAQEEITYRGVLYAGLMLTPAGPKVLEFNCRFGDPETQAVLSRLETDLLDVFEAVVEGRLEQMELRWDERDAVCVVMASAGYPDAAATPGPIRGLDGVEDENTIVYHAGTRREGQHILAAGGRVLGVTGLGRGRAAARDAAYAAVSRIRFEGAQFRTDIGA